MAGAAAWQNQVTVIGFSDLDSGIDEFAEIGVADYFYTPTVAIS